MAVSMVPVLVVAVCIAATVEGNGYLLNPLSRGAPGTGFTDTPKDYNRMNVNCGGAWAAGDCGLCGDNTLDPQPRDHEGGGTFGRGWIEAIYKTGSTIEAVVHVSSSHMGNGWFEFGLCVHNDPCTPADCPSPTLLADASTGETTFTGINTVRDYTYQLVLPAGVECTQCVFQWKYHTRTNSGASSPQDTYYGCADVAITADGTLATQGSQCPVVLHWAPPTAPCATSYQSIHSTATDQWCNQNCFHVPPNCPPTHCECAPPPPTIPLEAGIR